MPCTHKKSPGTHVHDAYGCTDAPHIQRRRHLTGTFNASLALPFSGREHGAVDLCVFEIWAPVVYDK